MEAAIVGDRNGVVLAGAARRPERICGSTGRTSGAGGSAAVRNLVNPCNPEAAQAVYGCRQPASTFQINNNGGGDNDIETWQTTSELGWNVGHGRIVVRLRAAASAGHDRSSAKPI